MWRLLESEIVTQSVYNADAEWDGECCWSWSYIISTFIEEIYPSHLLDHSEQLNRTCLL
jgi:hypothetical protein